MYLKGRLCDPFEDDAILLRGAVVWPESELSVSIEPSHIFNSIARGEWEIGEAVKNDNLFDTSERYLPGIPISVLDSAREVSLSQQETYVSQM